MSGNGDSFFKGFIFGGIVGGVLGLLLAPKSGREMRSEMGEEAGKIFEHSKSDFENARKAAMQSFEEGRDKIIEKMTKEEVEVPVADEEKPKKRHVVFVSYYHIST